MLVLGQGHLAAGNSLGLALWASEAAKSQEVCKTGSRAHTRARLRLSTSKIISQKAPPSPGVVSEP